MGTTVFLSRLPKETTRESLLNWVRSLYFHATLPRCVILYKLEGPEKGLCNGLGYVRMDSEEAAQKMVALNQRVTLGNKRITIVMSRTETLNRTPRHLHAPRNPAKSQPAPGPTPDTFEAAMENLVVPESVLAER
jgi:hypothetical protein